MNRLIPILLTVILLFTVHFAFSQGIWKTYTRADGLAGDTVLCIVQDKLGNYWFGCSKGLSRLDTNGCWNNFLNRKGENLATIYDIEIDNLNNKWLAITDWGKLPADNYIVKFDDTNFTYYSPTGDPVYGGGVGALEQDSLDHIWCGATDGAAYWFDGLNWNLVYIPGLVGGAWSSVNEIKTDRHGQLYFAHDRGISTLDRWIFYAFWTRDIDFDRQNRLWFGSYEYDWPLGMFDGNKWYAYTTDNGLFIRDVWNVAIDSSNNIWIGYGGFGVSKFDRKNFTYFNQAQGLVHNQIWDIYVDRIGDIWFATTGGISVLHDTTITNVMKFIESNNIFKSSSPIQNYPNPFNLVTSIRYELLSENQIELAVYNLQGKEVTVLVNDKQEAGEHKVQWDGTDKLGEEVSSGVYIVVLKKEKVKQSIKITLIR